MESDDSSDSGSDDEVDSDAVAIGGIVNSRHFCTHLDLCTVCWDVCPGCEGEVEEPGPVEGEVVLRIIHSQPRTQLFPLAADREPVESDTDTTWENDSGAE